MLEHYRTSTEVIEVNIHLFVEGSLVFEVVQHFRVVHCERRKRKVPRANVKAHKDLCYTWKEGRKFAIVTSCSRNPSAARCRDMQRREGAVLIQKLFILSEELLLLLLLLASQLSSPNCHTHWTAYECILQVSSLWHRRVFTAIGFSLLLDYGLDLVCGGDRQASYMTKRDPGSICSFSGIRMLNQLKALC